MKKIFTRGLGTLMSIASFAFAPSKLIVSAQSNSGIKVVVDGNRYSQQSGDNSVVFDNLQPGYHSITVYQLNDRRKGFFRRNDEYRVLYSGSVNIRPMIATSVSVNRFGDARKEEEPMRGGFGNNNNHDRDYEHDRDFHHKQNGW